MGPAVRTTLEAAGGAAIFAAFDGTVWAAQRTAQLPAYWSSGRAALAATFKPSQRAADNAALCSADWAAVLTAHDAAQ